jgi:Zn-dependent M28 family amino/carboxypeptidase
VSGSNLRYVLSGAAAAALLLAAGAVDAKPAKPAAAPAAKPLSTLEGAVRVRDKAMAGDTVAMDWVRELTTRFGPRPAGSASEQAAAAWAAEKARALGLENVQVQTFPVVEWVRGPEKAELIAPSHQPIGAVALGESPPTPAAGIEAEIVMFDSLEALQAAPDGSLAGKIAVVNRPMVRMQDGSGYGPISRIRAAGPAEAAKKGAVAFMLRSAGTDNHRMGHTGTTRYVNGAVPIPAFALSIPDADQLARLSALGQPVRVRLFSGASLVTDTHSQNVIAEIKGSERPDEVVLLGCHLDSWDLGTGAIDDGAGCAITTAAVKLIQELPRRPKRTIRVVLFGSEEVAQPTAPFGARGGTAYATARAAEIGKHIAAGESDFGADRIYSLNLPAGAQGGDFAKLVEPVLTPIGVLTTAQAAGHGGTDIGPTVEAGAPVFELNQDGTKYFDIHHTADDTLDKIDPAQLNQNVAAWSALVWLMADSDVDFRALAAQAPKHP